MFHNHHHSPEAFHKFHLSCIKMTWNKIRFLVTALHCVLCIQVFFKCPCILNRNFWYFCWFSFTLTKKQVTCENVSVKESRKEIMTMDGQQAEGVNTTPLETKSLWPIPFYLFTLINIKSKFSVCAALLWLLPPSIFVPVFPASLCCGKERPGGQGWAQALSPSLSSLSLSLHRKITITASGLHIMLIVMIQHQMSRDWL